MALLTPPTPIPDDNKGPLLLSAEALYLVPFDTRTLLGVAATLQYGAGGGGGEGGTRGYGFAG
jgi:hypothetical protein